MARFETPIDDPQVAAALHGLDLQSVLMARSFERSSRLNAFIDQYVDPAILEHVTEDEPHRYVYGRVSAIGENGSLVHIRLHEQRVGHTFSEHLAHIAIISHVDDPNPAMVHLATSEDIVRVDATRQTSFKVSTIESEGLKVVEAPMNQLQWGVEQILAREAALAAQPLVHMTQEGWEYRRSDGHWEKLHDIHMVRERVARALSQGLGYAALPDVRHEPLTETGQVVEKMVV